MNPPHKTPLYVQGVLGVQEQICSYFHENSCLLEDRAQVEVAFPVM